MRYFISKDFFKSLYVAIIRSGLINGIEDWIDPNKSIQNHFIRNISFKTRRESAWRFYGEFKILSIKYLFMYKILKIFFNKVGNMEIDRQYHNTRSVKKGLFATPKLKKK